MTFHRFESVRGAGRLVPAGRQGASPGPHEAVSPDRSSEAASKRAHDDATVSSSLTAASS